LLWRGDKYMRSFKTENAVVDTKPLRVEDLGPLRATGFGNVVPLNYVICPRRRVRRGDTLYEIGDPCRVLYVVRRGVFKTFTVSEYGSTQVTGFQMTGDPIGLDGIATEFHQSVVVALEDAEVFVLPFAHCGEWSLESTPEHRLMIRTLAHEIVRTQRMMLLLGTTRAEQRVVKFLLDLSERYGRLGYSRSELLLRMTRQDIGDFLGLKLETISRVLSSLQSGGFIRVQGKSIALLDLPGLSRAGGTAAHSDRRGEAIIARGKMTPKKPTTGALHRLGT